MGVARDLFLEVGWVGPIDDVSHQKLVEAARLWRSEGQLFSAGIAMLRAGDADWSDPDRAFDAYQMAMKRRSRRCLSCETPFFGSHGGLNCLTPQLKHALANSALS
jgi:hypothetical protein